MKNLDKFLLSLLLTLAAVLFVQKESLAVVYSIHITLEGSQEVPPNATTAIGTLNGTYDDALFQLTFTVNFTGLLAGTTAAHFHAPAPMGVNAPIVIGFAGFPLGVTSGSYSNSYSLTAAQNAQIVGGLWYVNIHTSLFPGGEIRGQLGEGAFFASYTFEVPLEGFQEVPSNGSTGLGKISGNYNHISFQLTFTVYFSGLSAGTTAAHFHGPANIGVNAPIVIGFAGFPLGVTSGSYSNSYILTAAQDADLLNGLWYVNIHTSLFPGGEIRGQMTEGTLPVELSSFTSNILGNDVTLKWSTATETNNAGFDVERKSSSSTEWSKVGNVAGNGNSNELKNYMFSEKLSTGIYNYRLKQIDFNGNFEYFNLSNEVIIGMPEKFVLSQNYPNPFNPTTKINFSISNSGMVSMKIYNVLGKEVMTLVNETKAIGNYEVEFNAGNLASGAYFYRIEAGEFTDIKRMMLIK